MTTEIGVALATIEAALIAHNRGVLLDALQAGTDAIRVRSVLRACGLPASPEIEAMYSWRDGTRTTGVSAVDDIHIFPGFYLLTLEDAAANHDAFAREPRWSRAWFPLFANGGGDFYVADFGGPRPGAIRHFRIDEFEHPVEFASLPRMLRTLAAAFDRDVFFIDPSGYLEMDDLAFASLAAELNPEISWWTS